MNKVAATAGCNFVRFPILRRSQNRAGKIALRFVLAPNMASLVEMSGVVGQRWTIGNDFLRAKDDLGLDHCEVRSWQASHRHRTLVRLAAAFFARLNAHLQRRRRSK